MKKALCILLALMLTGALAVVPITAQSTTYDSISVSTALLGDVDGNNSVGSEDATFIQRKLVDFSFDFLFDLNAADTDEDGYVTIIDATHVQRHLSKMKCNENIGKPANVWVNKNTALHWENDTQNLIIQEIHPNYFYAVPITSLPVIYKILGNLSDHWCVGDHVQCTIKNVYYENDQEEGVLVSIIPSTFVPDPYVCYKPVIYLYPEETTDVSVRLDLDGDFLYTYPAYENGWQVNASPDGTLTDKSGRIYPYLFWEGRLNTEYDFSTGFCVKGSDTAAFLNDKLSALGLSDKEKADFTEFWLPLMQDHPYNVVSFQTTAFTDAAKLSISPAPDTTVRVFMAYYASDEAVDIPEQALSAPERSGFTAVEWGGGQMVKPYE